MINASSGMRGWAKVWAPASSGQGRNAQDTFGDGGFRLPPLCWISLAFKLRCVLRRERRHLCSGCTSRTIHRYAFFDMRNMPYKLHRRVEHAHPHCHLTTSKLYTQTCHPAMYNSSALSPVARSNPLRYILSARRGEV